MKDSEENSKKIQELQILEGNLQVFLSQKQSFQIELNETNNALSELEDAKGEVYKILSGVMIKILKNSAVEDLGGKKRILEMRISSIEKQERILEEKTLKLREEIAKQFVREAGKK